jgi:hypothetical protein
MIGAILLGVSIKNYYNPYSKIILPVKYAYSID